MTTFRLALALAIAAAPTAIAAQIAPPQRTAPEIVIATSAQLAPLLRTLAADYRRTCPGVPIRIEAVGSDVAMAALTTARADAAVIGRIGFDQEVKAYEWVYRAPPVATPLFRGSIATAGQSPALAVRVNAANPIRAITMEQLRALFAPGAAAPIWRAAGVSGKFAHRPAHLILPDTESGTGRFLRHALLADRVQFDWPRVREFSEEPPSLLRDRFGGAIATAVARDLDAVGIGDARARRGTRIVPILVGGVARRPGDSGYPFDRQVLAYGGAPRFDAAGFLDYARSPVARARIIAAGYRPL